ncbi:MAG: hypothetical protein IPL12_14185 [Bacteroidetes bacterium]|nr:hypothetical protein [Bacteroidota bacterium]
MGKSSLINMLDQPSAWRNQCQTGKRQTINFFPQRYLEPCRFGPATALQRFPKPSEQSRVNMIADYLKFRPQMRCVFQLVDSCIHLKK